MGFRRLRRRLDGLEYHAHSTMSSADRTLEMAKALIDELLDGVEIEMTVAGKVLPVTLRIKPEEDEVVD